MNKQRGVISILTMIIIGTATAVYEAVKPEPATPGPYAAVPVAGGIVRFDTRAGTFELCEEHAMEDGKLALTCTPVNTTK